MDERRADLSDAAAELLAAAGMTSTPEGRARARARLEEGRADLPAKLAAVRAQLGLPDRPRRRIA